MEIDEHVTFDPRIPKYKPLLSNFLIPLILIMYLVEIFSNSILGDKAIIILGAKWNEGITHGELWRFLTCTFLHGNLLHLFLNVAALYIFGKEVESIYGTLRFFLIYLFSSWGAGLASYSYSIELAIGASGAVFGIIGSLIIFFFRQREKVTGANMRFKSMWTLVIINLILGFTLPRIDNSAHIGGLISGVLISWFISPEYTLKKFNDQDKLIVVKNNDLYRVLTGVIITATLLFWLTKFAITLQGNNYQ